MLITKRENETPEEYNARQKSIVFVALKKFNPEKFSEITTDDIDVTGIDAGNMSYGFKVNINGKQDYFLKFSKGKDNHKQLNAIMSVVDFASIQNDSLMTPTPIKSEKDGIFVKEIIPDFGLPDELEGLTVSLQEFMEGKNAENLPRDDLKTVEEMARQIAKFHKYSEQYYKGHPEYVRESIPAESHKKLRPIEEIRKDLLENFKIPKDKSFSDIVKDLILGGSLFAKYKEENLKFIAEHQGLNSDQESKIKFLDRLKGVNQDIEKGMEGRVGKMFKVYADLEPIYDRFNKLPRGIAHNDVHTGNYIVSKENQVALIDFDDLIYQGIPLADLGGLIVNLSLAKEEMRGGKLSLSTNRLEEIVKPVLVAYDSVKELTGRETRDVLLSTAAGYSGFFVDVISDISNVKDNFNKLDLEIAPFNKIHDLPPFLDTISKLAEIAFFPEKDLSQWLRDDKTKSLKHLDLETKVLDKSVLSEVKDKQEKSWVEKMSSRTPRGSKEL